MKSFSVLCPHCGQHYLSTDASLIGQDVDCPACGKRFCARAEPALQPPPSSKNEESIIISCPHCERQLSVQTSDLGKCFDCPSCGRRFSTETPPGTDSPSLVEKGIVIAVAILIATGIVWVLREVCGLEGTKANKGFAMLGMAIAWGIWSALTGKQHKG